MDIRITTKLLQSKPYPWHAPDWVEVAVDHPQKIHDAIIELGIDRTSISADLQHVVGDLVRQFPIEPPSFGVHRAYRSEARAHWIDRLKNWFVGLEEKEEEETLITREVPLYVFNCPKVKKAKTTYGESETSSMKSGWCIEVLGTGFGSDMEVSISQSSQFVASPGDRKLVFAPLQIRVVRVALYKWGDFQERFLKSELAEPEVRDANAIRSINDREWRTLVEQGPAVERFDLSRDTSQDIATFKRSYELSGTFETKLGIKAFELESSVTAKCTATQKAEMTFELPAGNLYELRAPISMNGFYFFRP